MGRAPCCDKANVKKGPWSPEEDAKLKSYIEQNGTGGNWIALPQKIGLKRCGKSCRLRWLNYLRPNIKHGSFTEEEDNIICTLYVSIGSRWSIIAAQLPGRTDNDIKNYWNTRLKKKLLGNQRKHQHPPPPQKRSSPIITTTQPTTPYSSSNSSSASDNCVPMPPLVPPASIHDYDYNTLHHQYSSHDTQQHLYPATINNTTSTSLPSNNNMYDLQQGFENLTDDDLSHLMACVIDNQEQQMQMQQQGGYYGMGMASGSSNTTSTESTTTAWAPPPLLSVSDYELGGGHACRQSIISHYQHDDAVAFHQEPAASRYFGMQML
ncbi:hypothetical protein PIB30_021023 [Stylosanthes scabra]|uniref:Uncharacterized protein n=1 Tax=Stylosanthes scabra TaxID=79078 RepID=A0ABU6U7M2_9FABA|nr:hypothetical protein [Stylosanthes scabra]